MKVALTSLSCTPKVWTRAALTFALASSESRSVWIRIVPVPSLVMLAELPSPELRSARGRHPELGSAAELEPEIESLEQQATDGDRQHDERDQVEPATLGNDGDRALAAVEVIAEGGEAHDALPSVVATVRPGLGTNRPRPAYEVRFWAPSFVGSRPDHGWPSLKNFWRARRATSG